MGNLMHEILESVRRNRLRTCLTGFSVTWGIFMLIVLLGAGNGLLNALLEGDSIFVTNSVTVGGGVTSKPYAGFQEGRRIDLVENDMSLLRESEAGKHIDKVTTSYTQSNLMMTYGKRHFDGVTLNGTFPDDIDVNDITMICGRFINGNDIRQKRKVVVIHQIYARNFLSGGTDYEKLLGERIKVGDLSFVIVGVRQSDENRFDRDLYAPYTTVRAIYKADDKVDQIMFSFSGLDSEEDNELFESQVRGTLNSRHFAATDDKSAIWIDSRFTQNLQMSKVKGLVLTALWVIGLLTLLSGIVGVSNIMLISVRERTHEFGIRKAIGARPRSLMKLIVSESVAITASFGYLGMVLGMVACEVMDRTLGQAEMSLFGASSKILVDPNVGLGTAAGATVVLVVAGTLAGLVPAAKAAKVKPIEALRAE